MPSALSFATYHYLRDPQPGVSPGFDALKVSDFAGQLDWFARHYTVIHPRQLDEALAGGPALPERALLLSFDDGLLEHYTIAHPMLAARGWAGVFYAPAGSTVDRKLLDVHRIHLILSHTTDRVGLAARLRDLIDARRGDGLRSGADYYAEWARPGRYDDPDTVFVKRMMQRALPEPLVDELLDALLAVAVGVDKATLVERHYLTAEQARAMHRAGHVIGGHGDLHRWIVGLDTAAKRTKVIATERFLADICGKRGGWTFSYPYGGYDADIAAMLPEFGCAWAVTTVPKTAQVGRDDPYALPRFDTNDFPRNAEAPGPSVAAAAAL